MSFPGASIDEAKQIAEKYRIRAPSKIDRAKYLYNLRFMEFGYGLDDGIKEGKCGHFLHEIKSSGDCFSVMGAMYLVAKYSDLKPEMYWASGMIDIDEGESADDSILGEHSFITIKEGKDEYVDDPHLGLWGRVIKKEDGRWFIRKMENRAEITVERQFNVIKKLEEDDFVAMMTKHQSPVYGKEVLECGQIVSLRDKRVLLQYVPPGTLVSSCTMDMAKPFVEETPSKYKVINLSAPLEKGNWELNEGSVKTFYCKRNSWEHDKQELVHTEIQVPYTLALVYIDHLRTAASFFGRKSDISSLNVIDPMVYYEDKGFSFTGELTKENMVDKAKHKTLLNKLDKMISEFSENVDALPAFFQSAAYISTRIRNKSPKNPYGLIYSEEKRDLFVEDAFSSLESDIQAIVDQMCLAMRAEAGLVKNLKEERRKTYFLEKEKLDKNAFKNLLSLRRTYREDFEEHVDFALFQKDNPLSNVTASDDQIYTYLRYKAHLFMTDLSLLLPTLEVKSFRKGLEKILK